MNEVKEFIEHLPESYDKKKLLSLYEESYSEEEITFSNSYKLYSNISYNINKCYNLIFESLCKLGTEEVTFKTPIETFIVCVENMYDIKIKKIKFKKSLFKVLQLDRLDFYLTLVCDVFSLKDKENVFKENYEMNLHHLNDGCHTLTTILDYLSQLIYEKNVNESYPKIMSVLNKDIIITDPCYIRKYEKQERNEYIDLKINKDSFDLFKLNGWKAEDVTMQQILDAYKKNEVYNSLVNIQNDINRSSNYVDYWTESEYIKNYITSSTIYGDWSCTTYNSDTKEAIGEFCADAGEVGVFLLDEVLKYNPQFDYHINKPWTTTLIKNFTGEISIVKRHNEGVYEDDTEWHKKGQKWEEDSIHVIGKGNINFETTQTGF